MSTLLTRLLICIISFMPASGAFAQNKPNPLVEGGKTLVELIRVFKSPRQAAMPKIGVAATDDSCALRQITDLCFKNSSSKALAVTIYKRTDTGYDSRPFILKVMIAREECLYEMRTGIYKYCVEAENGQGKTVLKEGELKLQPCENMLREITE